MGIAKKYLSLKKLNKSIKNEKMLGSIIGDIVGSIYEFNNIKTKDFPFFEDKMEATDDSILTLATASWLLEGGDSAGYYADFANRYPHPMGGYGNSFKGWAVKYNSLGSAKAYQSCGNGSAMRVGPVGWAFDTEEEVMKAAEESAACTHDHEGGIAGAQATALCILWARQKKSKEYIRKRITELFHYDLTPTVEQLQKVYSWDGMPGAEWSGSTCQGSVPQAIICALDADGFEDAVRNAISIGGDSDTIGCITGSIAEALYGIPKEIYDKGLSYLNEEFLSIVKKFEAKYPAYVV